MAEFIKEYRSKNKEDIIPKLAEMLPRTKEV